MPGSPTGTSIPGHSTGRQEYMDYHDFWKFCSYSQGNYVKADRSNNFQIKMKENIVKIKKNNLYFLLQNLSQVSLWFFNIYDFNPCMPYCRQSDLKLGKYGQVLVSLSQHKSGQNQSDQDLFERIVCIFLYYSISCVSVFLTVCQYVLKKTNLISLIHSYNGFKFSGIKKLGSKEGKKVAGFFVFLQ